jgi:hypothetical protein
VQIFVTVWILNLPLFPLPLCIPGWDFSTSTTSPPLYAGFSISESSNSGHPLTLSLFAIRIWNGRRFPFPVNFAFPVVQLLGVEIGDFGKIDPVVGFFFFLFLFRFGWGGDGLGRIEWLPCFSKFSCLR